MRNALLYLSTAALLASGCHRGGSSDSLQRQQQQYDTVQEGQSTAVTSTITAPGEAPLPNAGMTGTNADTTTNFTLPQASSTTTTQAQQGTIAGTMTIPSNHGPLIGYPSNPPPPKPRPAAVTKSEPANTQPATDTTTTSVEGPPPLTSTTPPTTDTAPPPPPDTQPPPTTTTGLGPQADRPNSVVVTIRGLRPEARGLGYNPPPCRG